MMILSGCGDKFSAESVNNIGEAGFANSEAGFSNAGTAGLSTGGSDLETGGSTAGVSNIGGSSGMVNIGGSMSHGGNAGTGGAACKPLTCEDYAKTLASHNSYNQIYPNTVQKNISENYNHKNVNVVECGMMSDNCGGTINCGSCKDPYQVCYEGGGAYDYSFHHYTINTQMPEQPILQLLPPIDANICTGGCNYLPGKTCPLAYPYNLYQVYACFNPPADYETNPPDPSCILVPGKFQNGIVFCCDSQ